MSVMYWMFLLITLPAIIGCCYLSIKLAEARSVPNRGTDGQGEAVGDTGRRKARTRPQDYYLKITLRDPLAVARSESILGRLGSRLAPLMITREVYRKLQEAVAEQLVERRIAADFDVQINPPTQATASESTELEVSGTVVETEHSGKLQLRRENLER